MNLYLEYFNEKYVNGKTEKQISTYYLSNWRTFQISDHLPLWIELKIDFSNQFLQNIPKTTQKSQISSSESNTCIVTETLEKQPESSRIGNKNTKTFHLTTCKSVPVEENKAYFDSRQAALDANYKLCGTCKS